MSKNDNVIEFKKKEEKKHVVIDTKKRGSELNNMLDELWNTLHSGEKLTEIHSDEEGKIYYSTEREESDSERHALKSHLYFMVDFINKNRLAESFMCEYKKYLEYSGWDQIITAKNLSS